MGCKYELSFHEKVVAIAIDKCDGVNVFLSKDGCATKHEKVAL